MTKYYKKHSLFRRALDIIDDILDRFIIVYWISLGLSIAIPTLVVFYSLPNEIRTPISGIVSGSISLVLIPLTINYLNQKNTMKNSVYNENKELYYELSDIIVSIQANKNSKKQDNKRLNTYIKNNYSKMCLSFKANLIWDVISLYEEFELNSNNVNYYCEKILKKVRREAGVTDSFHINPKAISYISSDDKEV